MPSVDQALGTGAALRRLREAQGRTVREVSEAVGWSSSKLSRIETSLSRVKREDLTRLLDYYEAPADVRSDIGALEQAPVRRPRRPPDAVPDALEKYARLEEQASDISIYATAVVPGLLQTQEYAAAVIAATPTREDHLAKTRMQTRMARQAVLGRRPPPRLNVILDEATLQRPIGGEAVMRRQMLRLQELSDRPETVIRILPVAIGAHPALGGSFTILDFPESPDVPSCVWLDDLAGGVLRHKQDEIERYRASLNVLEGLALSARESAEVFAAKARWQEER